MAKVVGVLKGADRSHISVLTEDGWNVEICVRSLTESALNTLLKKVQHWHGNRVSYEYGASGISIKLLGDAYVTEHDAASGRDSAIFYELTRAKALTGAKL